jgi:hypothetical protein
MTKPVISSFGQISPLLIQPYERYLPTAFDGGLSILEKLNMIIQKLAEMGEVANEVITQWNTVMEWVMGDGLDEGIAEKINAMVLDGTFDTIINENIFADLNKKIDDFAINILAKGAIVDADNTTFLNDLIAEYPSKKVVLLISNGTFKVNTITIPDNVDLVFSSGGKLEVTAGNTLTINGGITAGFNQIFSGLGVVTGSPKIPFAYAEWFGAKPNDTGIDNTPLILKALKFLHTVQLTKGIYYQNTELKMPYGSTLKGVGRLTFTGYNDTILHQQGNYPSISFEDNAGMVNLDNFIIMGDINNPNNDGILFPSYGAYSTLSRLLIYKCGGHGIHAKGSAETGVDMVTFSSVKVDSCEGYGVKLNLDVAAGNGFNTSLFEVVECMRNQLGGFYINQADSLTFIRTHAFNNANRGFNVNHGYELHATASNLLFLNAWAEGNGENTTPDAEHKSAGFYINDAKDIQFISPRVVTQSRGFHIQKGNNIVIDKPFISIQGWASSLTMLIEAEATNIRVKNLGYGVSTIIANFSDSCIIETNNDLPTTGRIPHNSLFKRGVRGKAHSYKQGTATAYQYNATVTALAGNDYMTWTTSNNLRIGDNILIPGAGVSGVGLFCKIKNISLTEKKIYVDTIIGTSVVDAIPATVQALVYSENYGTGTSVISNPQEGDVIYTTFPNAHKRVGWICKVGGGTPTWQEFGTWV